MPRPRLDARELIGGPWAISLRAFVAMCLIIVPATLLAPPVQGWSPTTCAIAVVTQIVGAALVLLLADRTVLRNRRESPAPISAVVATGAGMGLIRIPALLLVSRITDATAPNAATLVPVAVVSVMVVGALYPMLTYLLAARDWYTSERARLIALDVRASTDRLRAAGALDATLDATLTAIELGLRDTRSATANLMAAADPDANAIAAGLLEAARSSMRPLSHDLWATRSRSYPVVRWRQIATCEVRSHPLPLLVPTIGLVVVMTAGTLTTLGALGCVVTVATAVASINALFRLGRAGVRRSRLLALPIAVAAVLVAAIPPMVVAAAMFEAPLGRVLLIPALMLGLVVAAGATAALRETRDAVVRDLAQLVHEKEIEQIALVEADERLRRDIAAYLHSTVQSDLVSASVALRNAALAGDATALERASAAALAALELRYDPEREASQLSVPALMETINRRWTGILNLTWEVADTVPTHLMPAIATILRESLANALIHGGATSATIRMAHQDAGLELTITDNGVGPTRGQPGLGSALLDDVTARQWTLVPAGGGGAAVTALLSS